MIKLETRLERNKRLRKQKLSKRLKTITILLLIILMTLGLNIVNATIVELNCLDNPILLRFDLKNNYLNLLGKTYYIDLKILQNIF